MPTVRNGRGELTVYDMGVPAPGSPSGPVQRMEGPLAPARPTVNPATPSLAPRPRGGAAHRSLKLPADRAERVAVVLDQAGIREQLTAARAEFTGLDAVRASASHQEAGRRLGVSGTRVVQVVSELRRAGQLPDDVDQLLRSRSGHKPRPGTAPVDRAGLTAGEHRRATAAAERTRQEREASVPATDAAAPGTTASSAAGEVATPLAPLISGLPCVSCSHATVCSIRPELEAWQATIASPVSPLAAITVVDARLVLSCEHFLAVVS